MIQNGEGVSGESAKLVVVDIPDEATDYIVQEYDGMESVIYVVDGIIYFAYADEVR